jgi:zinc and cadmium transporter
MHEAHLSTVLLLGVYSLIILLSSLAGGLLPMFVRLTHTRLQVAISFVAGLMLGVAVLHLMPHAWQEFRSIDAVAWWLLAGFLAMFFIQRFFRFHHHDVPDEAPEIDGESGHKPHACEHHQAHEHTLAHQSARQLSWSGAALGLTLHSLIDGIALAASVEAEARGAEHSWLFGLGTFAVIILHKPFDAMAIGTLMAAGGWSRMARHWVNGLFALAIPAGVLLFHFGSSRFGDSHYFLGAALAFAGGTFLCIAASDLLPELQFHSHDRVKLSVALTAGLVLAALIVKLETSGHDHHQHGPGPADAPGDALRPEAHQHEGHAHDH